MFLWASSESAGSANTMLSLLCLSSWESFVICNQSVSWIIVEVALNINTMFNNWLLQERSNLKQEVESIVKENSMNKRLSEKREKDLTKELVDASSKISILEVIVSGCVERCLIFFS